MDVKSLHRLKKQKMDRIVANMKFIGHLFLRQLIVVKVLSTVIHELMSYKESPEEHEIECVCVLLQTVGHELDDKEHGRMLMVQYAARLMDLKRSVTSDGKLVLSERVCARIQELLDLRQNGWQKRTPQATAQAEEDAGWQDAGWQKRTPQATAQA